MKLAKKNPEASLKKLLASVGTGGAGWHGYLFEPENKISHEKMVSPALHINGKLHKMNRQAEALAEALAKKSPPLTEGTVFVFSGGLILVIARADLHAAYSELIGKSGAEIRRLPDLDADKVYDALAPWRERIAMYEAIADADKIKSIDFRRNRHKNGTVLIVDDDHFTGTFASNLLKNDYDVIVEKKGTEAVKSYIKHAPNIVLLDIHMPDMDGHEILFTLRAIDANAAVIMVTADSGDDQIFAAAREGAIAFLRKPLAKDKLLKTIREAPGMKKFNSPGQ